MWVKQCDFYLKHDWAWDVHTTNQNMVMTGGRFMALFYQHECGKADHKSCVNHGNLPPKGMGFTRFDHQTW